MLFKYTERDTICWISIIISPRANSAAEKIRKKNVNDKMLRLSNIKPTSSTIIYNDIHISSAVSNKCSAVFTLSIIAKKKQKNKKNTRFKSPNTIYLGGVRQDVIKQGFIVF